MNKRLKHVNDIDDLDFYVEMLKRYHQYRRGFCHVWYKAIMFAIILVGFLSLHEKWSWVAVFTSVIAALGLVWDPSHEARDHEVLYRRYSALSIKIKTKEKTKKNYNKLCQEYIDIGADEPPFHNVLAHYCYNETCKFLGRGKEEDLIPISSCGKWTMNISRHAKRDFPSRSDADNKDV